VPVMTRRGPPLLVGILHLGSSSLICQAAGQIQSRPLETVQSQAVVVCIHLLEDQQQMCGQPRITVTAVVVRDGLQQKVWWWMLIHRP